MKKNVYLTLIRSPLWSLVKPEKNMLDPIFDFLTLPGLSLWLGDMSAPWRAVCGSERHMCGSERHMCGSETCVWGGDMCLGGTHVSGTDTCVWEEDMCLGGTHVSGRDTCVWEGDMCLGERCMWEIDLEEYH